MSGWFAYFTLCASVGTFGVLAFLPVKPIGKGYFRTVGIIALGLMVVTAFVITTGRVPIAHAAVGHECKECYGPHIDSLLFSRLPLVSKLCAGLFCVVLVLYPFMFRAADTVVARAVCLAGSIGGVALLVCQAVVLEDEAWFVQFPGLLASAAGLGLATDTMLLGHWYLNVPNLSFEYLKKFSLGVWLALGARVLISVLFVTMCFPEISFWDPLDRILPFARIVFGAMAIFFAVLAWRCAKIHSNQSATGILYVVLFFVIVGEMMGAYLLGRTGLPL